MERLSFEDILSSKIKITSVDKSLYNICRGNWDRVAKPLDSMGRMEDIISLINAVNGREHCELDRLMLLVFCSDNGIVEEGVSQSPQSVTALCAGSIAAGKSAVGAMARTAGVDMRVVDIGMAADPGIPGVEDKRVAPGTKNFRREPAMSQEELYRAIQIGMDLVLDCKNGGYELVALGEMGIGNTTTAGAVTAALLGADASLVAGRGAGLDDEGLSRKIAVIDEALEKYGLKQKAPIEMLRLVGGFDLAGMFGACLGGALYGMPIVLDGVVSMAAAAAACRDFPEISEYLILSHASRELAAGALCEIFGKAPTIHADMALGEGTGAVMMLSLLKLANSVYKNSSSFEGIGVDRYTRF